MFGEAGCTHEINLKILLWAWTRSKDITWLFTVLPKRLNSNEKDIETRNMLNANKDGKEAAFFLDTSLFLL